MHSFKDADGREWRLNITIGAVERLKKALPGCDLLRLAEKTPSGEPLASQLETDPALLCHAIFVLARHVDRPAGEMVTDEEFCDALDAGAIRAAMRAFWDELIDFFRVLDRPDLAKLIEAQQELIRAAAGMNLERVQMNLEAGIERLREPAKSLSTPGNSSGDWPASAD